MRDGDVFRGWALLVGEVVCDFLFLALWLLLTWAVHEFVGGNFPLRGVPLYIGYVVEAVLDFSALLKLCRLRLGVGRGRYFRRRRRLTNPAAPGRRVGRAEVGAASRRVLEI